MDAKEAAKVLREHVEIRRKAGTGNPCLNQAIDAAVAALEREPKPAYCCAKCGLAEIHPRERALSEDAASGNFRAPK